MRNTWGPSFLVLAGWMTAAAPAARADRALVAEPEIRASTSSEPVFDPKTFDRQHPVRTEKTVHEKMWNKRREFMNARYDRRVKFIGKLREKDLNAGEYQERLSEFHRKETSRLQKFQKKQFKEIQKQAKKGKT